MNTITTPNFMVQTAKILAELRTRTCIDAIDTEVLEDILQAALHECYDDGVDDGYDVGYGIGYDHGHSAVQE